MWGASGVALLVAGLWRTNSSWGVPFSPRETVGDRKAGPQRRRAARRTGAVGRETQ